MRILVTGGAGFIGGHLCERLLEKGENVICLDNFYSGKEENIKHLLDNRNFELVRSDIRNQEELNKVLKRGKIELIYHLAAVVGVKRTLENPKEVLDVNIEGTKSVLQSAFACGCEKVVNVSSSEVYGNPIEVPEREESPKNVELPYAVAKLVGEKYADIYYKKYGLKTTSLRLFNIYGPRQDSTPYGFVVGIFIGRVLTNEPPIIYGNGFQTRDFNYIDDCVEAMILAGEKDIANGEVLNIAAGRPITILDLATSIITLCGKNLEPIFRPEREYEIRHRFADTSKMRTVLGYKSKIELEQGLKVTLEWYKKNLQYKER